MWENIKNNGYEYYTYIIYELYVLLQKIIRVRYRMDIIMCNVIISIWMLTQNKYIHM